MVEYEVLVRLLVSGTLGNNRLLGTPKLLPGGLQLPSHVDAYWKLGAWDNVVDIRPCPYSILRALTIYQVDGSDQSCALDL